MKFTELDLCEPLLEALFYMGFEEATPIQEQAIPAILKDQDIIACAQTGTGKTGAFVIPIIDKIYNGKGTGTDTLIIVPTRELAIQIEQQIHGLAYFVEVGSKAIYGGGTGKDWESQKKALQNGTSIIVATPGKLLSHLQMSNGNFKKINHLVLDEADRMLDMGFVDDIKKIISYLPGDQQTLMFSATIPKSIHKLANSILKNPLEISLSMSKPAEGVNQKVYLAFDNQKTSVLRHILQQRKDYDSIIVFTSTKSKVSEITRSLVQGGFPAKGISSNLDQDQREEVLRGFRSKRIRILVATDVMSRGIDVKEINMVVNYDVPRDAEDYVHRVGRTARANAEGEAITLVNPKDMHSFKKIEKLIDTTIKKLQPPENLGPGPEWREGGSKSNRNSHFNKGRNFSRKKRYNSR